jgi:hypothetical protein
MTRNQADTQDNPTRPVVARGAEQKRALMFHLNNCSSTAPLFLSNRVRRKTLTRNPISVGSTTLPLLIGIKQRYPSIYLLSYTSSSPSFFRKPRRITGKPRSDTTGPPYHPSLPS